MLQIRNKIKIPGGSHNPSTFYAIRAQVKMPFDLARLTGVSHNLISRIERGAAANPDPAYLGRLIAYPGGPRRPRRPVRPGRSGDGFCLLATQLPDAPRPAAGGPGEDAGREPGRDLELRTPGFQAAAGRHESTETEV